jgi:hypothetical protein
MHNALGVLVLCVLVCLAVCQTITTSARFNSTFSNPPTDEGVPHPANELYVGSLNSITIDETSGILYFASDTNIYGLNIDLNTIFFVKNSTGAVEKCAHSTNNALYCTSGSGKITVTNLSTYSTQTVVNAGGQQNSPYLDGDALLTHINTPRGLAFDATQNLLYYVGM